MKKLRVMVLMHDSLVPPDSMEGYSDREVLEWKTEFDVLHTLNDMGHEAKPVGVSTDLGVIRREIEEWRPHVAFNLLEEFHGITAYDQHVVSYLELKHQPYTGCNPRGLMLCREKPLAKKILSYHRVPTPRFQVFERGRAIKVSRRLRFPLLVKSVSEEASLGIAQASIVRNEAKLHERVRYIHQQVKTAALVEEYIEGREFYVGVLGNRRLETLPIWELLFTKAPPNVPRIATARVKWDPEYQKKIGLETQQATDLPAELVEQIDKLCRRVYRLLFLSGYARLDLRLRPDGKVFVLEANPNPNLSYGEDFAESAEVGGLEYEELLQRILNLGLRYRPVWLP